MKSLHPVCLTSVTEIYGSGQKRVAVILEYGTVLLANALSPRCFSVEGRNITCVTVSDSYRGMPKEMGRFVELRLDIRDPAASTIEVLGHGPRSRIKLHSASVTVSQVEPILSRDGETMPPFFDRQTDRIDNGVMDRFTPQTFCVPESDRVLSYNLYVPKGDREEQKYPLVLFLHDAGSCSEDVAAALAQGSGAVIWAREAEMGIRPCYVVAPHFPEACANDDFEVTWQAEAAILLVKSLLAQYPIDEARIYGTGQSMGCMMLCEMHLRYPHFFAGSLLVAGQWDPKRMQGARDEAFWAVVAAGDQKAFPIMGECFENMEKAGGELSRGHMDARADAAILDETIRKQGAQGCNLNFFWFEGKGILPQGVPDHPGMHHVSTWEKAYDIASLREWLFEQRRKEKI